MSQLIYNSISPSLCQQLFYSFSKLFFTSESAGSFILQAFAMPAARSDFVSIRLQKHFGKHFFQFSETFLFPVTIRCSSGIERKCSCPERSPEGSDFRAILPKSHSRREHQIKDLGCSACALPAAQLSFRRDRSSRPRRNNVLRDSSCAV